MLIRGAGGISSLAAQRTVQVSTFDEDVRSDDTIARNASHGFAEMPSSEAHRLLMCTHGRLEAARRYDALHCPALFFPRHREVFDSGLESVPVPENGGASISRHVIRTVAV